MGYAAGFVSITVIHGGQTGVDRGAHRGALDAGFAVGGYMPRNGRDELGPIPSEVASCLRRCNAPGMASRTERNVAMCDLLLVVVEDAQKPYDTAGTALTLRSAWRHTKDHLVIDPTWEEARVVSFFKSRILGDVRLMVAGPRLSRWNAGELVSRRYVAALACLRVQR